MPAYGLMPGAAAIDVNRLCAAMRNVSGCVCRIVSRIVIDYVKDLAVHASWERQGKISRCAASINNEKTCFLIAYGWKLKLMKEGIGLRDFDIAAMHYR